MKYKVGDKVKVRTDLILDNAYGSGGTYFVSGMEKFLGKTLTIEKVLTHTYWVKETFWKWTDDMFEQPNAVSAKFSKEVVFK